MRINHNISAVIANTRLKTNENKLAESVERLSSGLKINHAYDDAAGMAIASKMKAQIKGLDRASKNGADGISVIETAEAAISETQSILQRMRELAVQAGNDTNAVDDREAIQMEIDSLAKEITRISESTEFNNKPLLDGSMGRRTYTNNYEVYLTEITDNVTAGQYDITVEADAHQAVFGGGFEGEKTIDISYVDEDGNNQVETVDLVDAATGTIMAKDGLNPGAEGIIKINGVEAKIEAGDDAQTVYEKIRDAAARADITCLVVDVDAAGVYNKATDGTCQDTACYIESDKGYEFGANDRAMVFVSEDSGSRVSLDITCDNEYLAQLIGIGTEITVHGMDAQISLGDSESYNSTSTIRIDGNIAEVTDRFGTKMTIHTKNGVAKTQFNDVTLNSYQNNNQKEATVVANSSVAADVLLEVTDIGTMTLHVGANKGQVIEIDMPDMSASALGVDDLNFRSYGTASKAITAIDAALEKVSNFRASLGAYQNRLEYAVASLDATSEKMTSALSRIEDTDMASEMTVYTQYSVLSQASTSVLAQANDIPQQALQLLS